MGGMNISLRSMWGVVNKFNKDATNPDNGYVTGAYLLNTGKLNEVDRYTVSEYTPVTASKTYTLVYGNNLNKPSICFYDSNYNYISGINYGNITTITFTTPNNTAYCRLSYSIEDAGDVMLNEGSTALPYEPYYKWVED